MSDEVTIEFKDERQITIPNTGLDEVSSARIAAFISEAIEVGYTFKSVACRQRDKGSQRDPLIVTTAVILTFHRASE